MVLRCGRNEDKLDFIWPWYSSFFFSAKATQQRALKYSVRNKGAQKLLVTTVNTDLNKAFSSPQLPLTSFSGNILRKTLEMAIRENPKNQQFVKHSDQHVWHQHLYSNSHKSPFVRYSDAHFELSASRLHHVHMPKYIELLQYDWRHQVHPCPILQCETK